MSTAAPPASGITFQIARALSVIGHPFVVIPLLMLAVAARNGSRPSLVATLVVVLVIVVPVTLFIRRQVRRETWTNFDVSVREDRPHLYLATFLAAAVSAVALIVLHMPRPLTAGCVAAAVLIGVCFVVNRFLKVSLHSAFGAFAAAALVAVDSRAAAVLSLFVIAVAWSRVYLRRHTTSEVVAGLIIGTAIGCALLFL